MYRDLDIIYFTLFPWDHPYSSVSLSFAKEFFFDKKIRYITMKDDMSSKSIIKIAYSILITDEAHNKMRMIEKRDVSYEIVV